MRPRIKIEKKAIMIDYATHTAAWVHKRHGQPGQSLGAFSRMLCDRGITKKSSQAYLDGLKKRATQNIERELAKPTLLKRLSSLVAVRWLVMGSVR